MHSLQRTLLASLIASCLAASTSLAFAQNGGAPAEPAQAASPAASSASAPDSTEKPIIRVVPQEEDEMDGKMPPEMDDNDPVMQAAFKTAKMSLGKFLAFNNKNKDPKYMVFAVKVGFHDGDKTEYMWVTPFERDGQNYKGRLNDEPRKVKSVQHEQQVKFTTKDVVDWQYYDSSVHHMYGNYTSCARLTKARPKDYADVKRIFGLDCKDHDMK